MKTQEAVIDSEFCTFSLGCVPNLEIALRLWPSSGGQASLGCACAEDAIYFILMFVLSRHP